MQTFIGKITHISPITERGEYKSLKFRVEQVNEQYPQSCEFTKSAKGDNRKFIDEFKVNNPIGSTVEVEYSFKSFAWKDKFINEVVAWKIYNKNKSSHNNSNSTTHHSNASKNENGSCSTDTDVDLPF